MVNEDANQGGGIKRIQGNRQSARKSVWVFKISGLCFVGTRTKAAAGNQAADVTTNNISNIPRTLNLTHFR
ncbi:MAG: hypothetical protein JWQ25_2722, partial [Daejeonella sp.]|nr:hypothetical protein [Daejeonella sp.]